MIFLRKPDNTGSDPGIYVPNIIIYIIPVLHFATPDFVLMMCSIVIGIIRYSGEGQVNKGTDGDPDQAPYRS